LNKHHSTAALTHRYTSDEKLIYNFGRYWTGSTNLNCSPCPCGWGVYFAAWGNGIKATV
jgi:hypothetical protein